MENINDVLPADPCPTWCARPADHDLHDPACHDLVDGAILRSHEAPVLMAAGRCRLDLFQFVIVDPKDDLPEREAAGVRVDGLTWPHTLTAAEARQLAEALLVAAEVLEDGRH